MAVLLFNRTDGGSSGAIWKALNISGLSGTSLCCIRKAVEEGRLRTPNALACALGPAKLAR